MIEVVCVVIQNNNLVPIKGERKSFRLRQRAKDWQGCVK